MPRFSVMTWNVENLFAPTIDVGTGRSLTGAEYQAKLDYLSSRINREQPTVLALQEVGGEEPVADLQGKLGGTYPHSSISTAPDHRGIRVAFLSQLPVLATSEVRDLAPGELAEVRDWTGGDPIRRMGRGALRIDVQPAGAPRVRVVTLHLKSKLITYRGQGGQARFSPYDENERAIGVGLALLRRAAEAVAVRVAVNGLLTDQAETEAPVVVLGDLNDEPRAATSQLLLGPEDADATRPDKGDAWRLFNLTDSVPCQGDQSKDKRFVAPRERFSRVSMGRREMLDQILVSRTLLGEPAEVREGKWRVKRVKSFVDGISSEGLVGGSPTPRVGRERPDHAPVIARFEW